MKLNNLGGTDEQGKITGLEEIPDGSLDDFDILDSLDRYTNPLSDYLKKVSYGGKIIISGTDLGEIAHAIVKDELSSEEARGLLYAGRRSLRSVFDVIDELTKAGFKPVFKGINTYQYSVIGERSVNGV